MDNRKGLFDMIKRMLFFFGVAILGTFYFFVTSRIFQPDVSEYYRACYIDKRLNYWNLKYRKDRVTPLNWKALQISQSGWSLPDTAGIRLLNSPASISLQLKPVSSKPAHIFIESRSFLNSDYSPTDVQVLINDRSVGALHSGLQNPTKPQMFPVPDTMMNDNRNKLTITFIARNSPRSACIYIQSIMLSSPVR